MSHTSLSPSAFLKNYEWLAARTGIKVGTLRALVCRKKIPHVRITERTVRFDPAAIERWLEARIVADGE
ncbi:MAG: helix-turn-helix domain-containing protein [Armatimonadota bacterium]